MKQCVGIHSSEMSSSPKRKRMGDRPIFQQVSPSTAISTLSDCYNGLQLTFPSVSLCSGPVLAVSPFNTLLQSCRSPTYVPTYVYIPYLVVTKISIRRPCLNFAVYTTCMLPCRLDALLYIGTSCKRDKLDQVPTSFTVTHVLHDFIAHGGRGGGGGEEITLRC